MAVRRGDIVTLAGVAIELAAALAGARAIESQLHDVSPRDPVVFAATTSLLVAVALLACWVPGRRAARLTPLERYGWSGAARDLRSTRYLASTMMPLLSANRTRSGSSDDGSTRAPIPRSRVSSAARSMGATLIA